jgi:hypothetical protein
MKKIFVLITVCCLLSLESFANINSKAGTYGLTFLKIGVGARAVAMGKAFVGISDDIYSLYWNPAGISQLSNKEIAFSYNMLLAEISQGFLGLVYPYDKKHTIGVSATFLDYGKIQGYDKNNIPTEEFTTNDMLFSSSLGYKITEQFFTGITIKILQEKLENESIMNFGSDIGIIYKIGKIISFGATIRNIGTKIDFINKKMILPTTYDFGCGISLIEKIFNIGLVCSKPVDYNPEIGFGAEYILKEIVAFRIGYKYQNMNTVYDGIANLSVGVGIKYLSFTFDYAFVPYGALGNTHYLSFTVKF